MSDVNKTFPDKISARFYGCINGRLSLNDGPSQQSFFPLFVACPYRRFVSMLDVITIGRKQRCAAVENDQQQDSRMNNKLFVHN